MGYTTWYSDSLAFMDSTHSSGRPARFYAWLSIVASLVIITLKTLAYLVTGSVGLLSDAVESIANVVAAGVALWALTLASRPPDAVHAFGHSKAEYFSSALEGVLILVAAGGIAVAAGGRLFHPQPLESVGLGLVLSIVSSGINATVAWILLQASHRLRSITLRADAYHLLTDVWTSIGVILGIVVVKLTGWLVLDPLIALGVAANIVWTGIKLLRETGSSLLDAALPTDMQETILLILDEYKRQGIQFHALRTRVAGSRGFVSFHVLVPGQWTVQQGHNLCEAIELALLKALPGIYVMTHLEPLEDPASWQDEQLDRLISPDSSGNG
ncbi:cation diffusion facilitator family transporter [Leptolyngbya sp. NK1-12]|nr:cation diffusion facilitator family transporter [Leptolyngbya sp. NK1-12]